MASNLVALEPAVSRAARVRVALSWLLGLLADIVGPRTCVACAGPCPRAPAPFTWPAFATRWWARLAWARRLAGLSTIAPSGGVPGALCAECAGTLGDAPAGPHHAAFLFDGGLKKAVVRLKYEGRFDLGPGLGGLLAASPAAARALAGADRVVAVPLHARRLVERGFNQAQLLAEEVARRGGVALDRGALVRVRGGERQAALDKRARSVNAIGAYLGDPRRVRGHHFVVIDDVVTTGATLDACVQALLVAGASSAVGLALARAPDRLSSKQSQGAVTHAAAAER
ncbi:MAG: hypothetical protein U0271_42600 [Polyangiaceae bacterium]